MHLTPTPVKRTPGRILAEEMDPDLRLQAHLELGRRALASEALDLAETHFTEARDIDPTDERPKAELRGLGRRKKRSRWWLW